MQLSKEDALEMQEINFRRKNWRGLKFQDNSLSMRCDGRLLLNENIERFHFLEDILNGNFLLKNIEIIVLQLLYFRKLK